MKTLSPNRTHLLPPDKFYCKLCTAVKVEFDTLSLLAYVIVFNCFQGAIFCTIKINVIKYSIGNGYKLFRRDILQVKLRETCLSGHFYFILSL